MIFGHHKLFFNIWYFPKLGYGITVYFTPHSEQRQKIKSITCARFMRIGINTITRVSGFNTIRGRFVYTSKTHASLFTMYTRARRSADQLFWCQHPADISGSFHISLCFFPADYWSVQITYLTSICWLRQRNAPRFTSSSGLPNPQAVFVSRS